jgi:hypothetical protein
MHVATLQRDGITSITAANPLVPGHAPGRRTPRQHPYTSPHSPVSRRRARLTVGPRTQRTDRQQARFPAPCLCSAYEPLTPVLSEVCISAPRLSASEPRTADVEHTRTAPPSTTEAERRAPLACPRFATGPAPQQTSPSDPSADCRVQGSCPVSMWLAMVSWSWVGGLSRPGFLGTSRGSRRHGADAIAIAITYRSIADMIVALAHPLLHLHSHPSSLHSCLHAERANLRIERGRWRELRVRWLGQTQSTSCVTAQGMVSGLRQAGAV